MKKISDKICKEFAARHNCLEPHSIDEIRCVLDDAISIPELAASRDSRQLSAVPSELQKIKRIVDIVDSVAFWQYPNDKNLVSVNLKKLEMELMERGIAG